MNHRNNLRTTAAICVLVLVTSAAPLASSLPAPIGEDITSERAIHIMGAGRDPSLGTAALVTTPASWECDVDPLLPETPLDRVELGTAREQRDPETGQPAYVVTCLTDEPEAEGTCTAHVSVYKSGSGSLTGKAHCGHWWQSGSTAKCTVTGSAPGNCADHPGAGPSRSTKRCVASGSASGSVSCWFT